MVVLLDMLFSIVERHNQSYIRAHREDEGKDAPVRATQRAHAKLIDLIRTKSVDKATTFWRRHLIQVGEYMIGDPTETVLDVLS
jgi:DNA-binding FadR family transcriptional regulator